MSKHHCKPGKESSKLSSYCLKKIFSLTLPVRMFFFLRRIILFICHDPYTNDLFLVLKSLTVSSYSPISSSNSSSNVYPCCPLAPSSSESVSERCWSSLLRSSGETPSYSELTEEERLGELFSL